MPLPDLKAIGSGLIITLIGAVPALGLTIGQIDTFESGTTENWTAGLLGAPTPVPPTSVASGGPTGVNDGYLFLQSVGGANAGSRLTVINPGQWAGNYLAAGIGAITMNVNNFGNSDLDLRLLFEDPQGGPPVDVAFSKDAIHVPAGSGWTSVTFPIAGSDLQAASGSVNNALLNATAVRIYNSPAAAFPGPAVVAALGVDNITAAAASVPDVASTAGLMILALLPVLGLKRLRERSV